MNKFTVNEILPLLENVKQAGEGFTARCPVHDDNNNSLSINEGREGEAICNCFAGCSQETLWNYFKDKLHVRSERSESKEVKRSARQKPVALYTYVNSAGEVIDTKQRFEPGLKGENKSFLWINGTAKRKQPLPLYHLPAILAATTDSIIFCVEGEKDANTLSDNGFTATSIKDGFTKDNITALSNRQVVIIADFDPAGTRQANKAASLVADVTDNVKVINTSDFYDNAPAKSDITDFLSSGGDMSKVFDAINKAPIYKKIKVVNNSNNPLAKYYDDIEHYFISSNNMLIYQNGDQVTPLCYGALAIKSEITKYNGVENDIYFEVLATNLKGEQLPPVYISASEFNSLNWVIKSYGCNLALSPATSAKQKLITGITLSGLRADRERVYTHSGYLYKNNRPVNYLHFGGDLRGDQTIKTDIDNNLSRYQMLSPGTEQENKEAIKASLGLLEAHNEQVTFPLFAFVYMAALTPIINNVCGDNGFCLYLQGKTQSGKSTLAALAASHFGQFNSVTPPASFAATGNAINEFSFILKDCVLWVDDYHPQGTAKDKRKIDVIFQSIARAAGDKSTRARLTANSALKANHPPRSLFLVTGEDCPAIGQSGVARVFTLPVTHCRKDIKALTQAASEGILSRANSVYINYIIDNYDLMLSKFKGFYDGCLEITVNEFGACRLANQTALLLSSLYCFIDFAIKTEVITDDLSNKICDIGTNRIIEAAKGIEKQITDIDPVNQYMRALSDVLNTGRKYLIYLYSDDLSGNLGASDDVIGYSDDLYIYLDSNLAYKSVSDYMLSENNFFSISKNTIQNQLLEKGYIIGHNNSPTIVKKIKGRSVRVIRFNKEFLLKFNTDSERGDK